MRAHRATGTAIVALVLAHVALLFVLSPDDALFAMSPDGPTRARMALIATVALLAAAVLGALGPSLPVSRMTWRSCTPTSPCSCSCSASGTPCSPTARSTKRARRC